MLKSKKTIKEEIEELLKKAQWDYDCIPEGGFEKLAEKIIKYTLQRFIEETKLEKLGLDEGWSAGYNDALKELYKKQQQWLKENL